MGDVPAEEGDVVPTDAPEADEPEVVLPELTWNGTSCMGPNGEAHTQDECC